MTEEIQTPAVPNMTIVAHDDNSVSVLDRILEVLQIVELVDPLIINIIHPTGFKQVTVGGNVQKTDS